MDIAPLGGAFFSSQKLSPRLYSPLIPKKRKETKKEDILVPLGALWQRDHYLSVHAGHFTSQELPFVESPNYLCKSGIRSLFFAQSHHPATFRIFISTPPCHNCSSPCNVLYAWFTCVPLPPKSSIFSPPLRFFIPHPASIFTLIAPPAKPFLTLFVIFCEITKKSCVRMICLVWYSGDLR